LSTNNIDQCEDDMKPLPTLLVAAALAASLPIAARSPAPTASAQAARSLVYLLDNGQRQAVAAVDPAEDGAFVAALYIPGGQLLVVRARHPSADAVRYRIDAGQYREVYLDLQATPDPKGKFFVQDANANGILSAVQGSGDVDVLYEDGVRQTLFDGKARAQGLTAAEYDAKLAAADAKYADMLKLLAAKLQRGDANASGGG
jgi:hypothetical protein